jgi:hypothetical protein
MKRLIGGLLLSLGLLALPAQAQTDAQVSALVEALRKAAPDTGTTNDGLYSDWQIKGENIPRWSRLCTGKELTPTQFETSPVTARGILVCVVRDVLREQYETTGGDESLAVLRAASWWMTGDANNYNSASINDYTQRVLGFYQQEITQATPQTAPATGTTPARATTEPATGTTPTPATTEPATDTPATTPTTEPNTTEPTTDTTPTTEPGTTEPTPETQPETGS